MQFDKQRDAMNEIIQSVADKVSDDIYLNGFANPGVNGPYNCVETSVRNTAHWIGVYKYLWKLKGERKYYELIKKLANYLVSDSLYGSSGAIQCMVGDKMDQINGIIGQGWVIEGLKNAYEVISDRKYIEKARSIFIAQKFNYITHIWERIELNGENIGPDKVFNHQLWFCAAGVMLIPFFPNDRLIEMPIKDFVSHVGDLFEIYSNGLIRHYLVGFYNETEKKYKYYTRKFTAPLRFVDQRFDNYSYERAYHLFCLYGLALINEYEKDAEIFNSMKFKKALQYGLDIERLNKKINAKSHKCYNKYAYMYNSPAFEYPLIDFVFNNSRNQAKYYELWKLQCDLTYSDDEKSFSKLTNDPETLSARLYELTKYLEKTLN